MATRDPLLPHDMHLHAHLSKERDVREDGGLRVTNPAFCHHVLSSDVSDMLRTRSLPVRLADGDSTLLIPTLPSRFTSHASMQEATRLAYGQSHLLEPSFLHELQQKSETFNKNILKTGPGVRRCGRIPILYSVQFHNLQHCLFKKKKDSPIICPAGGHSYFPKNSWN